MKSLKSIFESTFKSGFVYAWDINTPYKDIDNIDPDQYISKVMSIFHYIGMNDITPDIIEKFYNIWINYLNGDKFKIPFRFDLNKKKVKISRNYSTYADMICDNNIISFKSDGGTAGVWDINGHKIKSGEGSIKSDNKGVSYEAGMVGVLNWCIQHNIFKRDNIDEDKLFNILRKEDSIDKEYLKEYVQTISSMFRGDEPLSKRIAKMKGNIKVEQTGAQDTTRRDFHTLFHNIDMGLDADEKINIGEIISDITIIYNDKERIFLSMKMPHAQLSGIFVGIPFAILATHNTNLTQSDVKKIDNDYKYEIAFKKMSDPIIKFFNIIGINPELLKDLYGERDMDEGEIKEYGKKHERSIIKDIIEGNKINKISTIIAQLIGYNYWYVSPKYCFEITKEDYNNIIKSKFEIKNSVEVGDDIEIGKGLHLSPRGITVRGYMNGVDTAICLRRTDGKPGIPNRLFAIIPHMDKFLKKFG